MLNEESGIGSLLSRPVQSMMSFDVIALDGNDTVSDAIEKMREKNARCVLVTHKGEIIGFVSKTDILFKVMGRGKDSTKFKLREIMSSPVLTITPSSSIGEALHSMDKHTVRQLIVSLRGSVMGVVTRESLFEEVHKVSVSAATAAMSGTPACIIDTRAVSLMKDGSIGKVACPYCDSPFDDKGVLSKHIDRIHGGSGVLEGDVRRMFE